MEGQLPALSRYDDDSEDSEDEGWLQDGRVKYRADITLQGRAAFRPTRVDIRMDPADLPEYLQPLMEGVSEDLTLRQREELAAAIYEHMDVFSSGIRVWERPKTSEITTTTPTYSQARDREGRGSENAGQRSNRALPKQLGQPCCPGNEEGWHHTLLRRLP